MQNTILIYFVIFKVSETPFTQKAYRVLVNNWRKPSSYIYFPSQQGSVAALPERCMTNSDKQIISIPLIGGGGGDVPSS